MEENIYFKQKNLFDPHDKGSLQIHVYGVGSIGSHIVAGLTKMGMDNITIYDYDNIEIDNLPAQFYPYNKVVEDNEPKVKALQSFIKEFVGVEITTIQEKITENTALSIDYNSIHIVCFDNIEGRKNIFNTLKGFPVHYIDGRIGAFNLEKYYLLMNGKDEDLDNYSNSLEGEFTPLSCGDKTLWSVNSMLASKIIADVIKISKGMEVTKEFKSTLMSDLAISKK